MREELIAELIKDLVGPRYEEEELDDRPVGWYTAGILFPKNTELTPEDGDTLEAGNADEEDSDETSNTQVSIASFKQNSIGISCQVRPDVKEIIVDAEYAKYAQMREKGEKSRKWVRRSVKVSRTLQIPSGTNSGSYLINDEAEVLWAVNEGEKYRVLTVFLYNIADLAGKGEVRRDDDDDADDRDIIDLVNELCIFQPRITLRSIDNKSPFNDRGLDLYPESLDEDANLLNLLYRNKSVYAKGFNCAAVWDLAHSEPMFVHTEIIPVYKAKGVSWSSDEEGRPKDIDMYDLAYATKPEQILALLETIPSLYERWINHIENEINSIQKQYPSLARTAEENILKCKAAAKRIRDGISLLNERPDVFEAFVFANRAMLLQRAHYSYALSRFRGTRELGTRPEPREKGKHFWRPFQLAFILLNLRGISDPSSRDRDTADLLWFPTGGGKTEAYLGLSAFTLALRRISGRSTSSKGAGVAVIMRYTLRLLTIQQFQRAAALICACEKLRRQDMKSWGEEPFLIGLWVGRKSTPNTFEEALEALGKLRAGSNLAETNPIQMSFCPWCGHGIDYGNYYADRGRRWIVVYCGNPSCEFTGSGPKEVYNALPVLTVDEDIYRRCPSMLIGTVDKFARMPWRPLTGSIFGYVDRYCEKHGYFTASENHPTFHNEFGKKISVYSIDHLQGPDLIIQDELHLISGPLGTMVGLYETAVEYLSTRQTSKITFKPKVIVSTATVRGVRQQVQKLFNRSDTETFPPPGIDAADTFFWRETEKGGRIFVGVSAPSTSMKTAVLRIYASLLQKVQELKQSGKTVKEIDPYWTLVGYFNSKRELGGTLRLLEDDVVKRIDDIVRLVEDHGNFEKRTIKKEELTSRKGSSEIPEILAALENDMNSPNSIDVLLATNMISVGVDVDRLGLMVVNGQPKNSAEYIQAVGRIGRKPDAPGLVVTLYNAYRPRDLSHYENFIGYHSMLQRYVDYVSLTPFSERALDRALHAVLIAMIRLKIGSMAARTQARSFVRNHPEVQKIVAALETRFLSVEHSDPSQKNYDMFVTELNKILEWWGKLNEDPHSPLAYHKENMFKDPEPKDNLLMINVGEIKSTAKVTPNSMRDVEKEANLYYTG